MRQRSVLQPQWIREVPCTLLHPACVSSVTNANLAAIWSQLLRRLVQIHRSRHSRPSLRCPSRPAPSNSIPLSWDSLLVLRSRPYQQLHREPLRRYDRTPQRTLHQYGRRRTELQGRYSAEREGRGELEERAVFEAGRVDSVGYSYCCGWDGDLGDYCVRAATEREGMVLFVRSECDVISNSLCREKTSWNDGGRHTISTSTHFDPPAFRAPPTIYDACSEHLHLI